MKWKHYQSEGVPDSHDDTDSDSKEPRGVVTLPLKRHIKKDKEEKGCSWKRARYEKDAGNIDEQNDNEKKEGRHCELCGAGSDGKALISTKGKHENDGFGDEDGWLGHLLGPINDRNGIPRIWVHYQCAIWSPEVHFSGLGHLKNVKVALNRGKSLKCSHCRRRGATLGCRVDECPKTYHLACARSNGCKFDHKEFLMACMDHRHIFQPHGDQIKLRAKKTKLEMRKQSNDSHQKDIQEKEKWVNNHDDGEDEVFLKRENKKPDGDKAKIAPTYIGGSHTEEGEKEKLLMAGWESVGGLQHVIQCMKEVVVLPLLYPEFFEGLGIMPPRGVLLHGYPGTGKTHVVRALVGSCARGDKRIAYFSRKGADCLGKYVGDSEQHLRQLFQVAEECQPSIIFFDEIDGLAPCRTRQQDQTHNSVVTTLLALLDGLKSRGCVVVIGATNRPDAIDPALRRPGRFDREIYFPLPSLEDRISILSLYTQKWPKTLESNEPLLQWIARKTSGFAGADLQALCTQTAIIALKRTFPLKQVLHANSKDTYDHLPVIIVEERDWLEALSSCPPPCSRREATVAANDVVSSPLPSHLIPCLIRPLSTLLVSLYLEECISLPDNLSKAATIIKSVMVSALERKKMVSNKWWSHVDDFIQQDDIVNEIERKWQGFGVNVLEDSYFANSDKFILEDNTTSHANGKHSTSFDLGNSPGFRIMIAGNPRSGQRHLASCIVNCFVEHVQIKKVDMATIISQGYNDLGQGISYTIANCLSRGSCLIFMPRVDLWAIESRDDQTLEHDTHPMDEQCIRKATFQKASYAWTIFLDQVESLSLSKPFIFLATSEVPFSLLPQEIRHFFQNDLSNCKKLVALEHNIPPFSVQIDGTFNHDLVITQSAAKLSGDMVKLLVLLIHQKNHVNNTSAYNKNKPCDLIEERTRTSNCQKGKESTTEDPGAIRSFQKSSTKPDGISNTTSREKTNLLSAISAFGYQILQSPQFSELCWVTSKLKEGPSADISESHWKDWKFSSCVLHPTSSSEKENNYGMVKGLVAVGLSATRGVYTSLQEVCSDVRAVLNLLVEKINEKVDAGKERCQYACLLSQVASLEDIVYSWAYTLQSLKQDSLRKEMPGHSTSNSNQIQDKKSTDEKASGSPNVSFPSTKTDPESLPTSMCSINCCSDCFNILHVVIKKILMHEFGSKRFDWSTENIHDMVMSLSVNLLTAVRKLFVDGVGNHSFDEKQREENYDKLLEFYDLASCGCKISRNMIIMPLECSCHSPSGTSSSEVNASSLTQLKHNSKFIFNNNILVDLDPGKEVSFHCKFNTLCLSSLIQLIVMIKKPFN